MRAAANHFRVPVFDLKIQRRQAPIVWRRHVAMYLAYKLTTRSLPSIGRRFGGFDHTTVIHAIRRIEPMKDHPDVMAIKGRIRADTAEAAAIRAATAEADPNQLSLKI
jgi:chromosomal replication initiation ATPase DnaA